MTSSIDATVLQRYLERTCTPDQAQAIAQWLREDPRRETVLTQLKQSAGPEATAEIEQVWSVIQQRMVQQEGKARRTMPRRSVASLSPAFWRIGVGIAGLVVIVGLGSQITPRKYTPQTFATTIAQRGVVHLPNGVQVTLAPQTTLRVRNAAEVDVTGEAFFYVPRHSNTPFLVHAGRVAARVLGTVFDVRRYDGDAITRIVVADGKVQAGAAVLTAGMVGQASDSSVVVTQVDDLREYTSWTTGELRFRDVPVSELLAVVGRWYGYELRLMDTTSTLAHEPVTTRLDYPSARDMFTALQSLLNVTLTFDGRIVTLHPRRMGAPQRPRGHGTVLDSIHSFTNSEVGR